MNNSNLQKVIDANSIFSNGFLHSKALYLYRYNHIPSIHFITGINGEKAFDAVLKQYDALIEAVHVYRPYDKRSGKYDFDETALLLKNSCLVEFGTSYCEIHHNGLENEFIKDCTILVQQFKERARRKPLEMNLIVAEGRGLYLKAMEIRRTKLDLDLFYNDDFKEVDAVIQKRLNQRNDNGIVLLHGLPGTGKTTYLRYLIGRIKKRVLFLSPNIAGNLTNPEFIDLLIDNPNTVVIIEDAENIITDRRTNDSSAVSSLLNISDGLLADFLNVQLICTFNNSLTLVDGALLRKGRLIARYEFGKLNVSKAQRLSDHLGFEKLIDRPMTVAEISNQNEREFETKQVEVIGFRRNVLKN